MFLRFTLGRDSRQRKHLPHQATSYFVQYITLHISKINSQSCQSKILRPEYLVEIFLIKKSLARDFQSSDAENWKRMLCLRLYAPLYALLNSDKWNFRLVMVSSPTIIIGTTHHAAHNFCSKTCYYNQGTLRRIHTLTAPYSYMLFPLWMQTFDTQQTYLCVNENFSIHYTSWNA